MAIGFKKINYSTDIVTFLAKAVLEINLKTLNSKDTLHQVPHTYPLLYIDFCFDGGRGAGGGVDVLIYWESTEITSSL